MGPSIVITPSDLPSVICSITTSSITLRCIGQCIRRRTSVTPTNSFALSSRSCRTFIGVINTDSFACGQEARRIVGLLRQATHFRKYCRRTGKRFSTLTGGVADSIGRSLGHPGRGRRVGGILRGSVIDHCCFEGKTVQRRLGSSGSLGITIRVLSSVRHCGNVLGPLGG